MKHSLSSHVQWENRKWQPTAPETYSSQHLYSRRNHGFLGWRGAGFSLRWPQWVGGIVLDSLVMACSGIFTRNTALPRDIQKAWFLWNSICSLWELSQVLTVSLFSSWSSALESRNLIASCVPSNDDCSTPGWPSSSLASYIASNLSTAIAAAILLR